MTKPNKTPPAPASTAPEIETPAGAAPHAVETKEYPDGTTATGAPPLPDDSPADTTPKADPLVQTAPEGDPIKPEEGVYACNVITLAAARALPEVGADVEPLPMVYAPGSIERFKAEDGRTMSVIRVHGAIAAQIAKVETA